MPRSWRAGYLPQTREVLPQRGLAFALSVEIGGTTIAPFAPISVPSRSDKSLQSGLKACWGAGVRLLWGQKTTNEKPEISEAEIFSERAQMKSHFLGAVPLTRRSAFRERNSGSESSRVRGSRATSSQIIHQTTRGDRLKLEHLALARTRGLNACVRG